MNPTISQARTIQRSLPGCRAVIVLAFSAENVKGASYGDTKIECKQIGYAGKLLEPIDDPASVGRVLAEVRVRREEQDDQHGGPAHDDTHTPGEWVGFIRRQTALAMGEFIKAVDRGRGTPDRLDFYESKLLDVAALAVAAIQSSRRKRA
jgi:hypothetical protein